MIRICAWCKEYQGEKEPLEDLDVTHDICPRCLENMRQRIEAAQPAFRERYQSQDPVPSHDHGAEKFPTLPQKVGNKVGTRFLFGAMTISDDISMR
jgi:hypothetical protein